MSKSDPTGIFHLGNEQKIVPYDPDWKALYYEACLTIAELKTGTVLTPRGLQALERHEARHHAATGIIMIVQGPAE